MYPAKKFGVKVTQYFVGFGNTHLVDQAGRDRVRHQGHPTRRLRQARRHAASGRERRPARGPRHEHRPVHPAHLRRPSRRVRARHGRRSGQALLQEAVVAEADRDVRRADGQRRHRGRAVRGGHHGLRRAGSRPRRSGRLRLRDQRRRGGSGCTDADPITPARQAGLQPGDEFVTFNGTHGRVLGSAHPAHPRQRRPRSHARRRAGRPARCRPRSPPPVIARASLDDPERTEKVGFLGVEPVRERPAGARHRRRRHG